MEHLPFKTHFNYELEEGELNSLPSCTEPDLSMSVRDMIIRMAQGIPIGGSKVYYPDDEDGDIPPDQMMGYGLADYVAEMDYLRSLQTPSEPLPSPAPSEPLPSPAPPEPVE